MALLRRNVALWLLAACSVVACGDKFTAADTSDAGTGGTTGGAAGSSGGSIAGRGGRGGSAGSQGSGGDSGAAGTSGGAVGADGTGSDGAAGTAAGSDGKGGSGGIGISGAAGRGGSAGSGGSAGTAGAGSGGSGGVACGAGELRCSDGRCAKLTWNFESQTLDGIVVRSSSGHPLEVGMFEGSPALAMDVAELNIFSELSFHVPVCSSGTLDLRAKTLSFHVYFDGTPRSTAQFFVQAAVPEPNATMNILASANASTGVWLDYSAPMATAPGSAAVTKFTIQVGSTGANFSGTIWFDDIEIR